MTAKKKAAKKPRSPTLAEKIVRRIGELERRVTAVEAHVRELQVFANAGARENEREKALREELAQRRRR